MNKSKTYQTAITVSQCSEGQRVDNFLKKLLKKVPKDLIYKIIRKKKY